MSGESYVTSSAVIPIINLLTDSVLKEKDDDPPLVNDLCTATLADRLGRNTDDDVVHILEIASFLDSRLKTKHTQQIDNVKETVCADAAENYVCHENSTTDLTDKTPPRKKRTLGSLLKSQETDEPDTKVVISPEQKVKQEMQRYLVEPKVDEEDPLKWWKHMQLHILCYQVSPKSISV